MYYTTYRTQRTRLLINIDCIPNEYCIDMRPRWLHTNLAVIIISNLESDTCIFQAEAEVFWIWRCDMRFILVCSSTNKGKYSNDVHFPYIIPFELVLSNHYRKPIIVLSRNNLIWKVFKILFSFYIYWKKEK